MKTKTLAPICLLLCLAGTSSAQSGDQAQFKSLLEKFWAAWSTLDVQKAAPFYAKDAGLVFFDVAPLKYTGWEEYQAGAAKVFADWASMKAALNDDLKVDRRKKIAWTSHTVDGEIQPKTGPPMKLKFRHTAVWERLGNNWVIVHEHVSVPMQ